MSGPILFASICSGIEAASVAVRDMEWKAVLFAEIEPFPSAVLAYHYPDVPNVGDFTRINLDGFKSRVDVLFGGTPCQAFSFAGKRQSLQDARGNLTLAYVDLAHALAENRGLRNAFWENVPGVLSTDDNAFGCLLAGLVGANDPLLPCAKPTRPTEFWRLTGTGELAPRWPKSGMVAGPLGRAAWRVFDAQFFGLPQRRQRVFLVADFGNGADPAAVLFEPASLSGNLAPRDEARESVASAVKASAGKRCGIDGAFGSGLVSEDLGNAEGGALDAPFLTTSNLGKTVNNQTPLVGEMLAHTLRGEGFDASEDGTGRGTPLVPVRVPLAFSCKDYGHDLQFGITPTLRAMGGAEPNGGDQLAVAFDLRGREGGAQFEGPHETANLRAASGGSSRSYVATQWAVRRLTPRECERLQGFPDDYTKIAWRNRPANVCPDGPRYKALGNSWAVNNARWIVRRLDAGLRFATGPPTAA
jgi:DNA (cytosine-5)-methyltransferase 1